MIWLSLALAAPGLVGVQGTLADGAGAPLVGIQPVTFRLYATTYGMDPLWDDTMTVSFADGAFAASLGAGRPLDLSLFSQHQGFSFTVQLASGIQSMPVSLASVPLAAYADAAGDAAKLGGHPAESYARFGTSWDWSTLSFTNLPAHVAAPYTPGSGLALDGMAFRSTVSWSTLPGVPSAFSDGTDDGAVYTAGTGLGLSGTNVFSNTMTWATLPGIPAGFQDGVDNGTVYTAGAGLSLSGANEFSSTLSWSTLPGVPSGFSDGVDDGTTYTAGAGVAINGTTISVGGAAATLPAGTTVNGAAIPTATTVDAQIGAALNDASKPLAASICARMKTASARTGNTLVSQLDADYTGAGVCGSGWHVCNIWESAIYEILGKCSLPSSWLVAGFSNVDMHRRALLSGQDSTQCVAGNLPISYDKWAGYRGRVHCTPLTGTNPVACCADL
jgi:hypothetical protein